MKKIDVPYVLFIVLVVLLFFVIATKIMTLDEKMAEEAKNFARINKPVEFIPFEPGETFVVSKDPEMVFDGFYRVIVKRIEKDGKYGNYAMWSAFTGSNKNVKIGTPVKLKTFYYASDGTGERRSFLIID